MLFLNNGIVKMMPIKGGSIIYLGGVQECRPNPVENMFYWRDTSVVTSIFMRKSYDAPP
jgi:hypothetical protein